MIATLPAIDRSDCVRVTQRDGEAFLFHSGEQFVWEGLPAGTRVLYPPPPLPAIDDVDGAIEQALENPLGADPLSAQLRPGMRLTIAFDDISLPLPPMCTPDIRQRVIERVRTFELALRLLHEGKVDLRPLVTHRFALTDYKRAIQTALATGAHRSIKTVFEI